jgi:signal transduction histidine kinase
MDPGSPWQAMARRRFLISARPWRSLLYLLSGAVPGILGLSVLVTLLTVGAALSLVLVGIPILAAAGALGVPMGAVERWRLQLIDPAPIADPHRACGTPGLITWLRTRYRESATWRELGYTLLFVTILWPVDLAVGLASVGLPLALVTSPITTFVGGASREILPGWTISTDRQAVIASLLGAGLLSVAPYLVTALAAAQGKLARVLLSPAEQELGRRLAEVTQSRFRLVNAFEAERRRIERDLHDGAQQRLVALSMSLGLASLDLPPGGTADQITHAQEQAQLALGELRDLIHGIHPRVLTERGLAAATASAADRTPVPVSVSFDLPVRPPPAVEATAYFVICEALANLAKHSEANRAWINGERVHEALLLEIGDDGVGGADPARGTGLTGLTDRVAVLGGSLTLSSPPGGPTVLHVEFPCQQP